MSLPDPLLLVGGCPRSGTTLVRNLIAAHRQVAVPNESQFLAHVLQSLLATGEAGNLPLAWHLVRQHPSYAAWGLESSWVAAEVATTPPTSYADLVRTLFTAYTRSRSKEYSADKTPEHALHFLLLSSLFPASRMVSVIRDPREVAMSLAVQRFSSGGVAGPAVTWRRHTKRARVAAGALGPSKFHEVRYERLVADPAREVERLCAFGGIPFDPDMLVLAAEQAPPGPAHNSSRLPVGSVSRLWRDEMTTQEVAVIEVLAGEEMERAGYPLVTSRRARLLARREVARFRMINRLRRRVRERWSPLPPPLPQRLAPVLGPVTPLAVADVELQ